MHQIRLRITTLFCGLAIPASLLMADNFPQFRGMSGDGRVVEQSIPDTWSGDSNVAWKIPMNGSGWSQPIVWDGKVYLTSAYAPDLSKPKRFADGVRMPQSIGLGGLTGAPDVSIEWQVQCIDANDGKVLWSQNATRAKPPFPTHPSNTYATESPVADASGVYAWFGSIGKLVALGHDGQPRWQRDFEPRKMSNGFGTGSSLAIHEGKLYLQNFSEETADLICVDNQTGEIVWQKSRDDKGSAWSTPIVWTNDLRSEVVVSAGDQVDSLNPLTGEVLWTVRNIKAATACSVCADRSRIYFGGSDPFSKGALFAIKAGASGDVSPDKKNTKFEYCEWLQEKAAPGMASPVSDGQVVYVVDKNVLRTYDAATGERLYQERVSDLTTVAASMLAIGDRLLLVDENGSAAIIATGREFKVLGSGKLDDTFWSTPAVADGAIYLRGVDYLYCLRSK